MEVTFRPLPPKTPLDYLFLFGTEFLGTFILVYIYTLHSDSVVKFGLSYFILELLCLKISGSHFNPCLTVASFLRELIG